jgi:dTDP-4-amino-4,6-dideoxygalactose transaminase
MVDAHQVTIDFEKAISEYTGAPYVVAVNSCTMALLLALALYKENGGIEVTMPARTYPSVPMSAHNVGLDVNYIHTDWQKTGARIYNIMPTNIWDCAKRFTSGMYVYGTVMCVSFHAAKMLKIGQGGAILHGDGDADSWYRQMRYDGRIEGVPTVEDSYPYAGYHCYLSPDAAARGLWLMQSYPQFVPDQEEHEYPDMSRWSWQK